MEGGAQLDHPALLGLELVHFEVEVELLRMLLAWPAGPLVVLHPLKRQLDVVGAQVAPVLGADVGADLPAQQPGVELGQLPGAGQSTMASDDIAVDSLQSGLFAIPDWRPSRGGAAGGRS
ncbi:hypothetical protein GCM10010121_064500 [Streptomyces brasiliensis]|uniref:Uncharacterized protein n=1 Tax=Streptomyces brasiliensis TaxID=1954 RepID=A0A917L4K9_9ACTN|nr:hypothetical protein GCM10010121_064500 [Streptomyces brasiliensis]